MSESDAAIAALYDHEQEIQRARDWGGDELFTQPLPRRRRFERPMPPQRRRDHGDAPRFERAEPVAVTEAAPQPAPGPEPVPGWPPAPEREPAPHGRRTVTITGHPGGVPTYRRPPRSIDERIAHRPERIASWTCSLGALSILLAIVTSQ